MGQIVGQKLHKQIESYHFTTMMKTMLKEALVDTKSDQIKELTTSLNVMFAERQKAEKLKEGGKKKVSKKKQLARDYDAFDDVGLSTQTPGEYVGFDDGDFM